MEQIGWENINVVRTFLEACINEVTINGREGGSLTTHSWTNVADTLIDIHNIHVNRKQMRMHYKHLKGKYAAWLKLRNKFGYVYNPSMNTFNLTNEEWESEMKSNRYIEMLRHTSLPHPDLCSRLFDDVIATGDASWGPTTR